MTTRMRSQAGFTLLELLVAMGVMLVVLAGTTQLLTSAMSGEVAASQTLTMNGHLRAAMDLLQRDLIQAGQGLPVGRRIGVVNGSGAERIERPGPPANGSCVGVTAYPDEPSLPAVSVGPDIGPPIDGQCTDVITIFAADNMFGQVPIAAIAANGTTAVIHDSVDISDDPDVEGDNLRPGDLLMLTKNNESVLMQVTAVSGQTVTFGTGDADDPLHLNQFRADVNDDTFRGTINRYVAAAPSDPTTPQADANDPTGQRQGASLATRIRLISYFVDTSGQVPRLMRSIGGADPNAVAIGVERFRVSYDLADQAGNPTNVRMTNADLNGTGACPDDPTTLDEVEGCSENQIRKVNVVLSMKVENDNASAQLKHGQQARSTLYSQVSLRSLAFVDRYQ
ncbi:MAG: prepilin-type N-terminal cleavage/methylation domain-containing protein [Vicinamibacterales bacterium]